MSRSSGNDNRGGSRSRRGDAHAHTHNAATEEPHALAVFLRELAERAEHDPALAARLREALGASGLLDTASRRGRRVASAKPAPPSTRRSRRAASAGTDAPPDPFVLLRERGEAGLRTTLEGLDLAALRTIVRNHRLDPARISARWTARERVIELIVTQVCGRANLGKAFARV